MKIFLVLVTALSFVATIVLENKVIPGVIGLISVVVLIKLLLNDIALLRAEQEAKENEEADKENNEEQE